MRKTNLPDASVVALRLRPLTGLVMSTATATITPPVGSFTVPCTVPAPPSSCARARRSGKTRDDQADHARLKQSNVETTYACSHATKRKCRWRQEAHDWSIRSGVARTSTLDERKAFHSLREHDHSLCDTTQSWPLPFGIGLPGVLSPPEHARDMGELLNLVGLSTGVVLYAMLLTMVRARGQRARRRHAVRSAAARHFHPRPDLESVRAARVRAAEGRHRRPVSVSRGGRILRARFSSGGGRALGPARPARGHPRRGTAVDCVDRVRRERRRGDSSLSVGACRRAGAVAARDAAPDVHVRRARAAARVRHARASPAPAARSGPPRWRRSPCQRCI